MAEPEIEEPVAGPVVSDSRVSQEVGADSTGYHEATITEGTTLDTFPVIELFGPTIQGEGAMIGIKTLFIRFGGCDYRCQKCDSMHAVLPAAVKKNATWRDVNSIVQECMQLRYRWGVNWITLSGGNPVMWDLTKLVQALHMVGFELALETQGSIWRDWVSEIDQVTVCPKGPGMGERFDQGAFQVWLKNLADGYGRMMGRQRVAIKSVVFNQMDFEFALLLDQILDKFNVDYSNTWYPKEDRYLSLGNYEPPVLDTQLDLVDPAPADDDDDIPLPMKLLRSYKTLLEDYLQDPRLQHWKFLPQLHVLLYSNQSGV